jgi:uncharacterized protein YciI
MRRIRFFTAALSLCISCGIVAAQTAPRTDASKPNPRFDPQLAKKYGGDKNGMKTYVLAILKTGTAHIAPGKERDEIFRGHFANIKRLAAEGKLAVAGPFDSNPGGLRGVFILNVSTVEEARKLTDTDPVVRSGLMVVDHYLWHGSAALMATPEIHEKISETIP